MTRGSMQQSTVVAFLLFVASQLSVQQGAIGSTQAFPIVVGGQRGWQHDEGDSSGYFQTFDALDLPGDLRRARKLHVFLPRSYGQNSTRRYPVAYFNDGTRTFFADGGGPTWDLASVLSDLYAQRTIPEMIVVGINPTDRDLEYTHASVPTRETCCELESYASYVAHQLKPFIDAQYRTRRSPSETAILGSSHGGLAAFAMAALYPDVFGMAGCLSSSFWVDMTPFGPDTALASSTLVNNLAVKLHDPAKPRLWLDWGLVRTGGNHNALIEAHATLRSKELAEILTTDFGFRFGETIQTLEDPRGEHHEASWSRRLHRTLPWLFRGVR